MGPNAVVEVVGEIIACGGWSRRRTLFGGSRLEGRDSALLDTERDAARIRVFFVRPDPSGECARRDTLPTQFQHETPL